MSEPRDVRRVPALVALVVALIAVGLAAGLIAFLVDFALGEPHVEDAIGLEEAAAAHLTPAEVAAEEAAADEEGMVEISRENQKSWGLLTGTLAVGSDIMLHDGVIGDKHICRATQGATDVPVTQDAGGTGGVAVLATANATISYDYLFVVEIGP